MNKEKALTMTGNGPIRANNAPTAPTTFATPDARTLKEDEDGSCKMRQM